MSVSKEKILTISATMLGLGTGIAATIGQQLLDDGLLTAGSQSLLYAGTVVGGGIVVNLLSNVAQDICAAFTKKVLVKHPDELNHDLKKALLTSLDKALNNVMIGVGDVIHVKVDRVEGNKIYYTATVKGESWPGILRKIK